MQKKGNIESFLREKLQNMEVAFQDDWSVFEEKLRYALYVRRLKRMMWLGTCSIVLLLSFVSVNVYHIQEGATYQPRHQSLQIGNSSLFEPAMYYEPTNELSTDVKSATFFNKTKGDITASSIKIRGTNSTDILTQKSHSVTANIPLPTTSTVSTKKAALLLNANNNDRIEEANAGVSAQDLLSNLEHFEFQDMVMLVGSDGEIEQAPAKEKVLKTYSRFHPLYLSTKNLDLDIIDKDFVSVHMPLEIKDIKSYEGPYVSPLQDKNPWSYALNVYPNFTYRKFAVDQDKLDYIHRDFIDAVQSAEKGGFSLNVGFEVSRRIGLITFLNSGIEYMTYNTEAVYNFTNFRDADINPTTGRIDNYSLKLRKENIEFTDRNTYHYLNFPLSISHQPWATNHIRLNIEVGGSFMYFVTAKGKTLDYKTLDIVDLSTRDFKKSMGSFFFKVGANYYVSPNINVGFEPTIMYFTNTIYSNDYPFKVVPYCVGMNFNIQINLN